MRDLAEVLRETLPSTASPAARRAADLLRETYRSGRAPSALAIADDETAAAYAAYRMPATHAAVGAALAQGPHEVLPATAGDHALRHLDLGGGTGAALWAVHARWPGRVRSQVLDASATALALGATLVGRSGDDFLAATRWTLARLDPHAPLPESDLVTAAYLLGELSAELAEAVVSQAMRAGQAVLLVEPGTPRGYRAILAARKLVLAAGWRILAPCPHALACPLADPHWCHDSVRLQRSVVHRQLKAGELGYEDEKFSYLYAVSARRAHDLSTAAGGPLTDAAGGELTGPTWARVLRHPVQRKGLVHLSVCTPAGSVDEVIISKRQGEAYKQARRTQWGELVHLPRHR